MPITEIKRVPVTTDPNWSPPKPSFRTVEGRAVIEVRGEGIDPSITPSRLVLVAPDGTERVLAVVDRARFERLLALAETQVEWWKLQHVPRKGQHNAQWNLDLSENFRKKMAALRALEPIDLDPLP